MHSCFLAFKPAVSGVAGGGRVELCSGSSSATGQRGRVAVGNVMVCCCAYDLMHLLWFVNVGHGLIHILVEFVFNDHLQPFLSTTIIKLHCQSTTIINYYHQVLSSSIIVNLTSSTMMKHILRHASTGGSPPCGHGKTGWDWCHRLPATADVGWKYPAGRPGEGESVVDIIAYVMVNKLTNNQLTAE